MFYRYRKWNIGDDLNVIVRCEHDGVISGSNGETQFLNIKTLNEWDTKVCSLTYIIYIIVTVPGDILTCR